MNKKIKLVLYDDGAGELDLLCHLRASFDLRTGAVTTAERQSMLSGLAPAMAIVPESLQTLTVERWTIPVNRLPDTGEIFLILNGRWTCPEADRPDQPGEIRVDDGGGLLAACLDRQTLGKWLDAGCAGLPEGKPRVIMANGLIRRPWHLLEQMPENLAFDLNRLAAGDRWRPEPATYSTIVGDQPVFLGAGAKIHPHVVLDTSAGPIWIDRGAEVRSMSVIVGPSYIGPRSVVVNHAHLRGHTAIGPLCKVGGEVNASVFQGCSNKGHAGYLGNSFVGEWVNLGAETCTSNLKNTYGPVRMQCDPDGSAEETGLQYLGSILGDHVKTAIGTRLLTGACIQTGTMLAMSGFAPKCVGPMQFVTDAGIRPYRFDDFWKVLGRVMERRDQKPGEGLRRRLMELAGL